MSIRERSRKEEREIKSKKIRGKVRKMKDAISHKALNQSTSFTYDKVSRTNV